MDLPNQHGTTQARAAQYDDVGASGKLDEARNSQIPFDTGSRIDHPNSSGGTLGGSGLTRARLFAREQMRLIPRGLRGIIVLVSREWSYL